MFEIKKDEILIEKNDQTLAVVSDLSKTLTGADACLIFLYRQETGTLTSIYNDRSDEQLVLPWKSVQKSLIKGKNAKIYKNVPEDLVSLTGVGSENSMLLYPVYDSAENLKGMLMFLNKTAGAFTEDTITLIDPMQRYLANVLYENSMETENVYLRREIALALYSKNSAISTSVTQDLESLGHSELFKFEMFGELKHKMQTQREKTFILICMVEGIEDIEAIGRESIHSNLPVIMIGPDDDDLILCAGKYNVTSYLPLTKYSKETLSRKISDNYEKIVKDPQSSSKISIFVGTTGGTGTTTISANLVNVLSMRYPMKNILYLDFSMTKAISNIFFGIPSPKKTIVDFIELEDYSEEHMLQAGLCQVKNNLYIIPGIQSHVEREELLREENTRKIIDMLFQLKQLFDFVIIDGGLAEDSELQIAVEEISDQIFIVTELTTIHISVLQTYYELMKKAGWKDKIKIVLNREDSQNAISIKDASEILNSRKGKDISFDIHIPNGGRPIRECWNFGKLITSEYPGVNFSKAIQEGRFYSDLEEDLSSGREHSGLWKRLLGKV